MKHLLALLLIASPVLGGVRVARVVGEAPAGTIEIRGVRAGPFDYAAWDKGELHLLPDTRAPLIEPREGKFRNVYAPSILRTHGGWDVYYAGWDGADTGNDRVYRTSTGDFLRFDPRETIIEHGAFKHVCNVSVASAGHRSLAMVCTTCPDGRGLNKPAVFGSEDGGRTWNGTPAPHAATRDDVVAIKDYPSYDAADVNGMNVLLCEDGTQRLYFGNFNDSAKVYRATRERENVFALDGLALDAGLAVNDVKKLPLGGGESCYLMGLHLNTNRLWYSLSRDGLAFAKPRVLCENVGRADAYIVSVGWVAEGPRLLGLLYGAGAAPSLDTNRIFARWLQKRVVVIEADERLEARASLGPDRQLIEIGPNPRPAARLEVFAEDGRTLLGTTNAIDLEPGRAYEITLE